VPSIGRRRRQDVGHGPSGSRPRRGRSCHLLTRVRPKGFFRRFLSSFSTPRCRSRRRYGNDIRSPRHFSR
jgi:hypothetical protein